MQIKLSLDDTAKCSVGYDFRVNRSGCSHVIPSPGCIHGVNRATYFVVDTLV